MGIGPAAQPRGGRRDGAVEGHRWLVGQPHRRQRPIGSASSRRATTERPWARPTTGHRRPPKGPSTRRLAVAASTARPRQWRAGPGAGHHPLRAATPPRGRAAATGQLRQHLCAHLIQQVTSAANDRLVSAIEGRQASTSMSCSLARYHLPPDRRFANARLTLEGQTREAGGSPRLRKSSSASNSACRPTTRLLAGDLAGH